MGEPCQERDSVVGAGANSASQAAAPPRLPAKTAPSPKTAVSPIAASSSAAPAAALQSEWTKGEELEATLSSMSLEELKKFAWLVSPPMVARGRVAPETVVLVVAGRAMLCPLLGASASRCVYAVGSKFAIKYEYVDPVARWSNKKE